MYFNKPLFENHFMKVSEFYDMVFAGDWVFDKFYEYTSSVYSDLNGDGQVNVGDLFGLAATTSKTVEHLQYNAGVTTTSRDKDGIPYISLNNEKTIKFVEKLYNLYYVNEGARIYQSDAEMDKEMLTMFKNDQMLFNPNWFHLAEKLRDMETDFGIVTYPKYDESQEDYKTLVHDGSSFFCVPVTISDEKLKVIGAVLEDMSYHAYRLITPAYFEVALKAKYSRDDVSSQMLDLMASSLYTDFAYVYSSDLNDIGMLRPLMKQKTSDFASWYAGVEEGVLAKFDQLLDVYLG